MDVVLQVRHPAAFVSSLKRYGWTHPFGDFLAQPLLMRDFLGPVRGRDPRLRRHPAPALRSGDPAVAADPSRHRSATATAIPAGSSIATRISANDPVNGFRDMYERLGLTYGAQAQAAVEQATDSSNPAEAANDRSLRRDSRASIWTWKSRLTEEEIERVRVETEPLWKEFYSDGDW